MCFLSRWHCISHLLSALYCNALSNSLNAATPSFMCINQINSSYLMACSLNRQSKTAAANCQSFAGCQPYVSCKVFLFPSRPTPHRSPSSVTMLQSDVYLSVAFHQHQTTSILLAPSSHRATQWKGIPH